MPSGPLSKFAAKTAQDVCACFKLGDEARPLLRPGQTPAQYLDALMDKQQYQDAVRFLAHGLPKREAVWWACFCAKGLAGTNLPQPDAAAIKTAERWVAEPNEENRQAAMPAAEGARFGTPAGCVALGAFFSGGSLGPPNVPAIPPAETLTGDAVAGAVMMAVVVKEPEKAAEKYKAFLGRGIEIANGKNLWK
jgi:hypothetical protein